MTNTEARAERIALSELRAAIHRIGDIKAVRFYLTLRDLGRLAGAYDALLPVKVYLDAYLGTPPLPAEPRYKMVCCRCTAPGCPGPHDSAGMCTSHALSYDGICEGCQAEP